MIEKIQTSNLFQLNNEIKTKPLNKVEKNFSEHLKSSIAKVNESQIAAETAASKLVSGEQIDLHNVMIASQKALVTLQTTVEIRNKVIEAYQEMMRMQV